MFRFVQPEVFFKLSMLPILTHIWHGCSAFA